MVVSKEPTYRELCFTLAVVDSWTIVFFDYENVDTISTSKAMLHRPVG